MLASKQIRQYLSDAEIKSITAKIAEAEEATSGEIRVSIRHRREWGEKKLSLRDLALKEFSRLGMRKTRDRTGVLIFLLMSERQFQIIADEGIHTKVTEGTWDRVAAAMTAHFRQGNFGQGICDGVAAVGEELKVFFPRKSDDRNELPDDVVQR